MVHKYSLRRIFRRPHIKAARRPPHPLPLLAATSYHLPEGRYYETPAVVKKQSLSSKKKVVLSGVVGAGLTLASVSSLQHNSSIPLQSANSTVLIRSDKHVAVRKERPPLMIASHIRQRPPSFALTAPLDEGVQHVAALIRPHPPSTINHDEMPWMTALTSILEQWAAELPTHLAHLDHLLVAISHSQELAPIVTAQAEQPKEASSKKSMPPLIVQEPHLLVAQRARTSLPAHSPAPDSPPGAVADLEINQPQISLAKINLDAQKIPVPRQKEQPLLPVPKFLAALVTNETPDILALGYAPITQSSSSTAFDSILTERGSNQGRFIPPIGARDHAWAANPLPPAAFTPKEQKCLAEAIYFEARSEKLKGQAAVAQVVLNRVRNPAYPSSICDVVYQNANWRNRCQFSFACDGKRHKVRENKHWRIAQDIAKAVTAGQIWLPEVGSSTHYHAVYVNPRWARSMYRLGKIGLHIFYRTKGGGWS